MCRRKSGITGRGCPQWATIFEIKQFLKTETHHRLVDKEGKVVVLLDDTFIEEDEITKSIKSDIYLSHNKLIIETTNFDNNNFVKNEIRSWYMKKAMERIELIHKHYEKYLIYWDS